MRRAAPAVLLALAAAVLVLGLVRWSSGCGERCDVLPVALGVPLLAGLVGALLLLGHAVVRLARRAPARPTRAVLAVALAGGLVAATPVRTAWSTGCDGHGAVVPLIDAPRVWALDPTRVPLAYEHVTTLAACPEPFPPDERS